MNNYRVLSRIVGSPERFSKLRQLSALAKDRARVGAFVKSHCQDRQAPGMSTIRAAIANELRANRHVSQSIVDDLVSNKSQAPGQPKSPVLSALVSSIDVLGIDTPDAPLTCPACHDSLGGYDDGTGQCNACGYYFI